MKKVIITLSLLLALPVAVLRAQTETDSEVLKLLYRKAEKTIYDDGSVSYYWEYKEHDGAVVIIEGDEENGFTETRIPKNSYFEIYKEYYPNGVIKQKGKLFGDATAIGIWYFFNEQGNLTEAVDEEKKFGKFGYTDILNFLVQNDWVEKGTHKGIFKIKIVFSEEDVTWIIRATGSGYKINNYVIDGNTGEIKQHQVIQGGKM